LGYEFYFGAQGLAAITGFRKEVDSFPRKVDPFEQVPLHERTEASRMSAVEAGEFVKIERGDTRPVRLPRCVHPAQLRVAIHRRASRGEAKHRSGRGLQRRRDALGERRRNVLTGVEHRDLHGRLDIRRNSQRSFGGRKRQTDGAERRFDLQPLDVRPRRNF